MVSDQAAVSRKRAADTKRTSWSSVDVVWKSFASETADERRQLKAATAVDCDVWLSGRGLPAPPCGLLNVLPAVCRQHEPGVEFMRLGGR